MSNDLYFNAHIRQCVNEGCSFRFPVTEFDKNYTVCPKCGAATRVEVEFPQQIIQHKDRLPEIRISFVLDNLRSVFNVGSIFRSSDGCGIVNHLYLCGTTPTPDHPKMAKTALGAEKSITWSYHRNGLLLTQDLLQGNTQVIALELSPISVPLHNYLRTMLPSELTLIIGNEVTGIDPDILSIVTNHIHIPMHGIKESLNVAIAASIFCYSV